MDQLMCKERYQLFNSGKDMLAYTMMAVYLLIFCSNLIGNGIMILRLWKTN